MSHIERCAYAHQDRIDEEADRAEFLEAATNAAFKSLCAEFLAALNGEKASVKKPEFLFRHTAAIVRQEETGHAFFDRLLDSEVLASLMHALQHSECPLIAETKKKSANSFASSHCDAMAAYEMQQVAK